MTRAKVIELTRYSKPWQDAWLTQNDAVIQRAGSQGDGVTVAGSLDNNWTSFHPHVMQFPVRGAYWYFGGRVAWQKQADIFLKILGQDFHFLACDFEDASLLNKTGVASAMEFCLYLKAHGQRVIFYTNSSIYQDYVAKYDASRAAQFPFWFSWPLPTVALPSYDVYLPPTPKARPDWTFWQYLFGEHSADGCEHDVFNGSVDDLRKWAGVVPVVPDPTVTTSLPVGGVTVNTTLTFHGDQTVTGTWRPA